MLIDLTTIVPVNDPLMEKAKEKEHIQALISMGHIGTHLDTYEKTPIPLDYFRSSGVVFDVRGKEEVQIDDIDWSRISEQSFVLFRTGRMEEYPYGSSDYGKNHPQLSHALIASLIEKRIRFIGVDCQGIRRHEEHTPADILCEKNGIYVIENLKNLGELPKESFTVYTMWLDDPDLTGLRCRVVAEI